MKHINGMALSADMQSVTFQTSRVLRMFYLVILKLWGFNIWELVNNVVLVRAQSHKVRIAALTVTTSMIVVDHVSRR